MRCRPRFVLAPYVGDLSEALDALSDLDLVEIIAREERLDVRNVAVDIELLRMHSPIGVDDGAQGARIGTLQITEVLPVAWRTCGTRDACVDRRHECLDAQHLVTPGFRDHGVSPRRQFGGERSRPERATTEPPRV